VGLRSPTADVERPSERVLAMFHGIEESSVIQAWLAQGRAEGEAIGRAKALAEGRDSVWVEVLRDVLLRVGTVKYGPPEPEMLAVIEQINDPNRLEALINRLMVPVRWEVLLATPVKDA
jgi:hypothetical protein